MLLLTLSLEEDTDNLKQLEITASFAAMVKKILRMSDIIMQNGSNSFFVLLTERTRAEVEGAIGRIEECWKSENTENAENAAIDYAYKYIDHTGEGRE